MTVLFRAQKISGAAQLQIAHRNLDTASQLRKFTDRLQTFFRLLKQLVAPVHEKRIRSPPGTSDATADLVELRQPQPVGVVDDDRVRIRNVQSRLNDGRGHQNVDIALDEIQHNFFQFMFVHLPVGEHDVCLRNKRRHMVCHLVDVVDTVVDIIYLSAPRQLPVNRLAHHLVVVLHDVGLNRQAVHRRFLQDAHIPDANETHMQGTRNRRRRQRQNVYIFL